MNPQRLNKKIKILLITFLPMTIINISAEDISYFQENWYKFSEIENILKNQSESLEAIKFNFNFIDHFDLMLATLEAEFNSGKEELLKRIASTDIHDLIQSIICNENLIQIHQAKKDNLGNQLINQEKLLQDFFLKYALDEQQFEVIKNDFTAHCDNKDNKYLAPILKQIPMILWISYFQRLIVMTKICIQANDDKIKHAHSELEADKQALENINKNFFEQITEPLWKISVELCKEILKKCQDGKAKYMSDQDTFSNDLAQKQELLNAMSSMQSNFLKLNSSKNIFEKEKKQLQNECDVLSANLRLTQNNKNLLEKAIIATEKIITHKTSMKTPEKLSFNDYFKQLGYVKIPNQ